jgi:guanylate kinase
MKGGLYILSAPSGAGKTTLIRAVLDQVLDGGSRPHFAVSRTTRSPRPGEVAGLHYSFSSRQGFEALIAEGEFLEWADVYGNYYGTPTSEVLPRIATGQDVILDIDVQGAATILAQHRGIEGSALSHAIRTIFILPPGPEALRQRMLSRRSEDACAAARRLSEAVSEISRLSLYDYVIVNDDLAAASRALASIILERRSRADPSRQDVASIVAAFRRLEDASAGEGKPG